MYIFDIDIQYSFSRMEGLGVMPLVPVIRVRAPRNFKCPKVPWDVDIGARARSQQPEGVMCSYLEP